MICHYIIGMSWGQAVNTCLTASQLMLVVHPRWTCRPFYGSEERPNVVYLKPVNVWLERNWFYDHHGVIDATSFFSSEPEASVGAVDKKSAVWANESFRCSEFSHSTDESSGCRAFLLDNRLQWSSLDQSVVNCPGQPMWFVTVHPLHSSGCETISWLKQETLAVRLQFCIFLCNWFNIS